MNRRKYNVLPKSSSTAERKHPQSHTHTRVLSVLVLLLVLLLLFSVVDLSGLVLRATRPARNTRNETSTTRTNARNRTQHRKEWQQRQQVQTGKTRRQSLIDMHRLRPIGTGQHYLWCDERYYYHYHYCCYCYLNNWCRYALKFRRQHYLHDSLQMKNLVQFWVALRAASKALTAAVVRIL